MVRTRLRNKFLKLKNIESRQAYNKQRNHCVSLHRKIKKRHYGNLNVKLICDNRKFCKQVKPFFNNIITANNNFTLMENSEIISEPTQCAEIMNNFFSDAALKLDVN